MTIIWWLRRDLRLSDNPALLAATAASGGAVLPCFILDERLLASPRTAAARVHFMLESLRELDSALRAYGSYLLLRRGQPLVELLSLLRETGARAVYANQDYSPYAQARDRAIGAELAAQGFELRSFQDPMIWEPNAILTAEGKPYTVYTPYWRRWWARIEAGEWQAPEGRPQQLQPPPAGLASLPIPTVAELGFELRQQVQPAGEIAGHALLKRFSDQSRDHAIGSYASQRDFPALPGTSRLSPHLRLGTVAPQACLRAALSAYRQASHDEQRQGARTWIGELAWRDFYLQILAHFPYVLKGAFKRQYDQLSWQDDPALLTAWQTGHTGYPIVDAAMRQLNAEAWMHNRLRMITASFLTKDLLVDWRLGERYFMQQLACGCPAANNGGWQWAAGTGTDAQPYFRIFNPTSQGQKFDPDGAFVKRYLPELADVPASFIHEPWKMSETLQRQLGLRIGVDYPAPVVDHKQQRERALVMYRRIKQ